MGNMTKNCKEMNFLNKKKNPQTDENAKKEKSDIPPIINENNHKNNNSNHDLSPCNLEQKFNEKNFTEKDFENSFCSIPDVFFII